MAWWSDGIVWNRIKIIVLEPFGICLPTPFTRRTSLFANERCHISFVLLLFINFLQVNNLPVSGLKIALDSKEAEAFISYLYDSSSWGGVKVVLLGVVRDLTMIDIALLVIRSLVA